MRNKTTIKKQILIVISARALYDILKNGVKHLYEYIAG